MLSPSQYKYGLAAGSGFGFGARIDSDNAKPSDSSTYGSTWSATSINVLFNPTRDPIVFNTNERMPQVCDVFLVKAIPTFEYRLMYQKRLQILMLSHIIHSSYAMQCKVVVSYYSWNAWDAHLSFFRVVMNQSITDRKFRTRYGNST